MGSKIWRYVLYALVWGAVGVYVVYSATRVRQNRKAQIINSVEIIIADSAMHGNLITTPMVEKWVENSGVKVVGRTLTEIPICDIESYILRNGFVDKAKIYPTRSGVLKVELSQRRAVMRLLMTGYNGYSTKDGYVFEAPNFASMYLPIITGSYKPPFPPSYKGSIKDFMRSETKRMEVQIVEIEREKYPLYRQEQENLENMRDVRKMNTKQRWFESDEKFEKRVLELRAHKAELRKLYRYRGKVITEQIAKISEKQKQVKDAEKKMQKRCEDFANLINFVHIVENSKFWSSEVVQIIASQSPSGELRVNLSVRSGDFEVVLGSIQNSNDKESESVEDRLDKLMKFYQDGLRRVGWNKYRSINIEYKGQVVCK
ncbi:MAG: hypothetical protein SNH35_04970 [Rikenellaceae bacterium]